MSGSQTIRDVVIRVSVEAGSSNLGSLTSAIQQQLGGLIRGVRNNASGSPGGSSGSFVPGSSNVSGAPSYPTSVNDGGDNRPRVGMPGYRDSVFLRADYQAGEKVKQQQKLGILSPSMSAWDTEGVRAKYAKKLAIQIAAYDREEEAAQRHAEKIAKIESTAQKNQEREQKKRDDEVRNEAARGIREWSRNKKKKKREHEKKAREQEQQAAAQHSAMIKTGKGIAQLAISSGGANPEITAMLAATEGVTNIAQNATLAFGAWGPPITAATVGILAYAHAMREARDTAKQLAEIQYQIASIHSQHAYGQVVTQASMRMRNISQTPERSQWQSLLPFIQQRTAMEGNIAAAQSGLGDNVERRDIVRRRMEEEQANSERKQKNESRLTHLRGQMDQNEKARTETLSNLEVARESHKQRTKALLRRKILVGEQRLETQQKGAVDEEGGWMTQGMRAIAPGFTRHATNSMQDAAGGTSDASFQKQNAEIAADRKKSDAEAAKAEHEAEEKLKELEQQRLGINQQIAQTQADQVHVTQKQVDEARKLAESSRRKTTQAQESYGAMDPGKRFMTDQLVDKLKRIEHQKQHGLPIEQLADWERAEGRHLTGKAGRMIKEMDKANGQSGRSVDWLDDSAETAEDEADYEKKKKRRKEEGGQQEKELGQTVEEQDAIADKIVEGMKVAFDLQKLADKLQEGFQVMKEKQNEMLIQINTWW